MKRTAPSPVPMPTRERRGDDDDLLGESPARSAKPAKAADLAAGRSGADSFRSDMLGHFKSSSLHSGLR